MLLPQKARNTTYGTKHTANSHSIFPQLSLSFQFAIVSQPSSQQHALRWMCVRESARAGNALADFPMSGNRRREIEMGEMEGEDLLLEGKE